MPQSEAKSSIGGIEAKASFIEREENRLIEWESRLEESRIGSQREFGTVGRQTSSVRENDGRTISKHGHECKNGHRCECG